jgi:outer membrane lipoprotein-sorting protein
MFKEVLMRQITLICIVFTLAQSSHALENKAVNAVPDVQKREFSVDRIEKTLEKLNFFSARFEQIFDHQALKEHRKSSGNIRFIRPGKLRWDYDGQNPRSFIINDQSLWLVSPQDNSAMEDRCFKADSLTATLSFIWGEGKLSDRFFIENFKGSFGNKDDVHVQLTPKKPSPHYSRLILVFDAQSYEIKQSVLVDHSGGVNRFLFRDLEQKKKAENTVFSLQEWPNINISPMPGSCTRSEET